MSEYVRWLSNYEYAELRIQHVEETSVLIKDQEIKPTAGRSYGVSVRVLENGSWGFASTQDAQRIKETIETAARLARLTKGDVQLEEMPVEKKKIRKKPATASLEERIEALQEARKRAVGNRVKNRTLNYMESFGRQEFYNSEGSEIEEEQFHAYFSCLCVARKNGIIQRGHETDSSTRGFRDLKLREVCETAAEKAERLLDADAAPQGRFTVILDNEMTGVFSHEAVGHACEGDSIIERESILRGKMGTPIGNEKVHIIDSPEKEGFGQYSYDEEGIRGKETYLVKGGVLTGYLTSRETAGELGMKPNGHARAMGYASFPIVRMSNTHFLPGTVKKEELFDLPYAIYVKGMRGGSVDIFAGNFLFKAQEGYEIRNGKEERMLRDVTLMGNILETLHNVEQVASDFATNPGFCGKLGQSVPVSDGGPHVRIGNVTLA